MVVTDDVGGAVGEEVRLRGEATASVYMAWRQGRWTYLGM